MGLEDLLEGCTSRAPLHVQRPIQALQHHLHHDIHRPDWHLDPDDHKKFHNNKLERSDSWRTVDGDRAGTPLRFLQYLLLGKRHHHILAHPSVFRFLRQPLSIHGDPEGLQVRHDVLHADVRRAAVRLRSDGLLSVWIGLNALLRFVPEHDRAVQDAERPIRILATTPSEQSRRLFLCLLPPYFWSFDPEYVHCNHDGPLHRVY